MRLFCLLAILVIFAGLLAGCTTHKTGWLEVIVQNADNEPLPGAKVVSDIQPDGQLKVTGLTDSGGRVVFKDIKPGNYAFYVSRFDYTQKEFNLTVIAGKTINFTIVLNP